MQTISTSGITLHVRDDGLRGGRAMVFANSLGTDLRVWDAPLPLLPAGLRIVRFDKRDHGLSDATPAPYAMDRLADDAEAVCDGLGLRDVTFVDLSSGGLIGQGLAARLPDLVRATADLCGAAFHVIPDAGHIPCVEQPQATAGLSADFPERTAP